MSQHNNKNDIQESNGLVPAAENQSISIESPLFIVAIGASAGGLEALKCFFSTVLPRNDVAYVLITHLSPDSLSILPELLQVSTILKVKNIKKSEPVKANHVYVLPPGYYATIKDKTLDLIEVKDHEIRLPIDFFLRALANDQGRYAICLILSGTGTDGTIGIRALKEREGLVIVQTIKSALYDGMPKSAINTGLVNYVLSPELMFSSIAQYIAHFHDNALPLADSVSDELRQILVLLNTHTGHDFSLYKPNTIFRRIQKRLTLLQIDNLCFYIHYLQQHPGELEILLKELLINVTHFFRDPEAFEALRKEIIQLLTEKSADYWIRVWVPGCSTGEEVYSIAILLQECMGHLKKHFNVQIFGTDIDEDAIEIARAGIFSEHLMAGLSEEQKDRFFVREGNQYKISIDIRKMIIFATQNLVKDPPFTKLDLLSCRNLLIYLSAQLQKKILPLFHYSLKPQGLLFLGTSETIGSSADLFTIVDRRWKIFARKGGTSSFYSMLNLPSGASDPEIHDTKTTEKTMQEIELNLSSLVQQTLLKNCTPACVIIDDRGNIVYTYGRASKFLEFASGEARLQVLEMVRPELRQKVSLAIRKSSTHHKEVVFNGLQYKDGDGFKYINLKVRPLVEAEVFKRSLFLIIFDEIEVFADTELNGKALKKAEVDKKITQLEEELKYTKESLQTTIEELETSNEELKSSNEELQSTNEELQSTNEEIETSKEELQSLNEELTTVNAELESRIEQLSSANDDIRNLLDNTEIATVFLDKDLCIKRFTPKATEIINLITSDVGRPLSHIVSNLNYENLIDDSWLVLRTLESKIIEVVDKNDNWYVVRIIPYRTVNNIVDGVVITFLNIHAQKQAEDKLNELKEEFNNLSQVNRVLLQSLNKPVMIINQMDKFEFINTAFEQVFQLSSDELTGNTLQNLKGLWDLQKLSGLCEKIRAEYTSQLELPLENFCNQTGTLSAFIYRDNEVLLLINIHSKSAC
ncbi:methyltransferase involved in chemotaxis (CheR domain) [Legionella quinlivanii]|uniref:Methyltransferase involved in chemotaxis (CheR domain) n=1 Tax=Legionella quinlivanii TaxID=45073 RepID=A0A0W0Y4Z9_9GAMM|nr:CheR family methyltransferase [Legionella quinlivanii]KTD52081.1 methyltransferase involved in chemotaxis (CheR domain) [Legionella quinlivanii]SEF89580.1 two-component system, chemotaxis family, CheB/CheR fusion protein [Legionella quinlivanii DSM 21216]STY12423.1 methyltransferase involved in chemotaxis (CheR domain) [Legionella quinlivanii]